MHLSGDLTDPRVLFEVTHMNFKLIFAALSAVMIILTGAAAAAEVSYDTSDVPDSPVKGQTFTVPVTITGDDIGGFTFKVTYDEKAFDVSFSDTGSMTTGGRPGSVQLVGMGACEFNIDIKIKASGSLKMSADDVLDSDGNPLAVTDPGCKLNLTIEEKKETTRPEATTAPADPVVISFDTSGVPKTAVSGRSYTVSATISGERVAGFRFRVDYDESAADVSVRGGDVVVDSRGLKELEGFGPSTITVVVTPSADSTVRMSFSDIIDADSAAITPTGSKTASVSFKVGQTSPTPAATETVRPTETARPTQTPKPEDTQKPAETPASTSSSSGSAEGSGYSDEAGQTGKVPQNNGSSGTESADGATQKNDQKIPGPGFAAVICLTAAAAVIGYRRKMRCSGREHEQK